MNILILGGSGYLGKKMTQELIKKNHNIVWLTRSFYMNQDYKIENWELDEMEDKFCSSQKKYDVLLLMACKYQVFGVGCQQIAEANLLNPIRVLEKCIEAGVKRIISIGTSLPERLNEYAYTKYAFSEYGKYCCIREENKIQFCNIKLENFYGEDEPEDRFLSKTIRLLENNLPIPLTDGNQKRDFIYIEDVVNSLIFLIESFKSTGYSEIPLGSGDNPSIQEVVEYLKTIFCSSSQLQFGKIEKRLDEPSTLADKLTMKNYGLYPKVQWKDGLKKYLEAKEKRNEDSKKEYCVVIEK